MRPKNLQPSSRSGRSWQWFEALTGRGRATPGQTRGRRWVPTPAGRLSALRLAIPGAAVLACVLGVLPLSSCGGGPPGTGPEPDPGGGCRSVLPSPYALWSEFKPLETVRGQLPALREHGISLYQNVRSSQVDARDPAVAELLGRAGCEGVELRAWLTLPEDSGYWPNEENADLFAEKALDLAGWIRASGWPIDWIVADMELGLGAMRELMDRFASGDLAGAVALLLGNLDPEGYARNLQRYTDLVESLHALGFKVMVVTFPMVLDDLEDGDASVQDALNIPVDGIPWDELSFMAYTTVFETYIESFLPNDITPYLVSSYAQDAREAYADRAAIDIGVIGDDGITGGEGITDLQEIRAQVGAAKSAGVPRIHAYSLDGILGMEDPGSWYEAFQAAPRSFDSQFTVDLLRELIRFLDRCI